MESEEETGALDELVGRRISHYEITERLGNGGMGSVYKARNTRLDRFVALKFLSPHLRTDEAATSRFLQEAKSASALDHPNICTVYDIDETEQGRLFIAMAYHSGVSLKTMIDAGPMPIPEALEYAEQIAEGLGAAHKAGIVHRDVKPANIMVTDDGCVKLVDFGLAKMEDVSLTRTGIVLGTPLYMSPEQASGQSVDHRTDLWALGVILYEMLTGQRPFQGDYVEAVRYAVLYDDPLRVAMLRPDVPDRLSQTVERLLQKNPVARFHQAGDVLTDLRSVREETAAPSTADAPRRWTIADAPRRRILRSPRAAIAAGGTLLVPREIPAGIPLLETKLYAPGWRPGLVSRPRLIDRMPKGMERKLTLVAAPAGFGKTTLLAEWLADTSKGQLTAGWVSLDQSDNDPAFFWAYVITALQRVHPGVGELSLSLLHSPQPPAIESVLTILINEIHALGQNVALILDDYHVIEAGPIHSAVAFLLDHVPGGMHVVIAARTDPDLPLARLRGRGELTELRAADLRFTPDEASAFLNEVMGLDLSPADVAALEARTEGWIAGLQLAALSMQARGDVHGFIEAFSGDNTYIADYLVEEVLQRQPERARRFLLQTSILGRLCGPLCDAVTEEDEGQLQLEAMERGNLFVVALDDRRNWYRYHHLFADVLQSRLRQEHPDQIGTLHRRASRWYELNGSPSDAIRHALASEEMRRAAGLIETAWPVMERNHQSATWLGWVKALPDELVRAMPVLSMAYAWALLNAGEMETAESRLRDVERWLDLTTVKNDRTEASSVEMIVVDEMQFRSLPQSMATARAYLAQALGDIPGTVKYARQALELIPAEDHRARAPAAALLGLAYWANGDLEAAHRTYGAGMAHLRAAGDTRSAIGGSFVLADIEAAQGRLLEAARTCEKALLLASQQIQPVFPGLGRLNLRLSELHREWGDLDAAMQYLAASTGSDEQADHSRHTSRRYTAMARIEEARGNLEKAYDLLDEADRAYVRSPIPDTHPVGAWKARIRLAQGRAAEVTDWATEQGLSSKDSLSYMREFEHITLAKVLVGRYRTEGKERSIHDAAGLLMRLLQAAEEGKRTGSVIEILMLQALAEQAQGNVAEALHPLERALTLAEAGKYLRIFVDEGEPMRHLLRHAAGDGIGGSYTRQLLSAFDESAHAAAHPARIPTGPSTSGLVRTLTEREVEILRLIAAGMRNKEIADHLFISPSTVKRHIANVYGKLDVGHRTEAVARANDLNLL